MNYVMYYDYDNFDSVYECIPAVRHGVAFSILDCVVHFQKLNDERITFWIDGSKHSKEEAQEIFENVSKVLSYLFAMPFYSKENMRLEVDWSIHANNLLSKKTLFTIEMVEKNIQKFDKTSVFFEETLDLLTIAIDNLFKYRNEDAFVYFFKVVERIAKQYYIVYFLQQQ